MKIICTEIRPTLSQKLDLGYEESSSVSYELTVGREYVVIGITLLISSPINRGVNFMVEDDIGRCAFVPACLFDITSPVISKLWIVKKSGISDLRLWPKEFFAEFFHDELSDGRPQTAVIFKSVCDRMRVEAHEEKEEKGTLPSNSDEAGK